MSRRLILATLCLSLAVPAPAGLVTRMDEEDAFDIMAAVTTETARECQNAEGESPALAAKQVLVCAQAGGEMERNLAKAKGLDAGDRALYHVVLADLAGNGIKLALRADGGISARVCKFTEAAWLHVTQVDGTILPAELETDLAGSKAELRGNVRSCRSKFGTPKGAAKLN